jgi:phospholipase C
MTGLGDKVQHVIVLMLENRSFDHLLGFVPGVGELTGAESNPSDGGPVNVSPTADYVLPVGPDHSHAGIMSQLANGNQGFVYAYAAAVAKARSKRKPDDLPADLERWVMRCFSPARVPVLGTLAQEFVTLQRWFASVPGETWPNRNYAHAATSHGQVDIKFQPYVDRTIFELLGKNDRSWRIYHDGPAQAWAFPKLWVAFWRHRFKGMDKLFAAIDRDELDHYSFVEPDHGLLPFDKTSNNQHPDNNIVARQTGLDFLAAEQLIAAIYERLRANPAVFEKTLFLITYDEHGGFYDSVPPPAAVPPDRHVWQKGAARFGFDRLGVRVPAVLVSPWLDSAALDEPVFDHSSIVASLRALFAPGAQPLNKRDAAAKTFLGLPVRQTPRTNLPAVIPAPLPSEPARKMAIKALGAPVLAAEFELDGFQQSLVSLTEAVNRRLDAETNPAVRRSRTGALPERLPSPATVRRRFRSHEELAEYMDYVTRRFHRSIDLSALELTDAEGRVIDRPDRATVERAFGRVGAVGAVGAPGAPGARRGKVSLRTANDLVVVAEPTGELKRIDLETGAEESLGVAPARARGAAVAAGPALAEAALAAIGRTDLR